MDLPKYPVILPSDLIGKQNGNLPSTLLKSIRPNYSERLHPKAATAWEWLRLLALFIPKLSLTTGRAGGYRTYNEQVTLFKERYSPTYNAATTTTKTKFWNGTVWYLKKNVADAGTPGSSNHGFGLAIDLKMSDGSPLTIKALNWLAANAIAYGFTWENNENWHLRYVAGDNLPAKVKQSIATGYPVSGAEFAPFLAKWGDYPYISKPVLKRGSNHPAVYYLKGFLMHEFNINPGYQSYTYLDTRTWETVKNLQSSWNISNDEELTGTVGRLTWAVIDSFIANGRWYDYG